MGKIVGSIDVMSSSLFPALISVDISGFIPGNSKKKISELIKVAWQLII